MRKDIALFPAEKGDGFDLFAGGLPTGDIFPVSEEGHICNPKGHIITYSRIRGSEPAIMVQQSTATARETVERTAKTILRIKSKIVYISPTLVLSAPHTILFLVRGGHPCSQTLTDTQTSLFDSILLAQSEYQKKPKTDPAWIKER